MNENFSALVVTQINGQRMCEETPLTHRQGVKRVQRMINNGVFFQGGFSHRLISFAHRKANFTRFEVLVDDIDLAVIDVHTICSKSFVLNS